MHDLPKLPGWGEHKPCGWVWSIGTPPPSCEIESTKSYLPSFSSLLRRTVISSPKTSSSRLYRRGYMDPPGIKGLQNFRNSYYNVCMLRVKTYLWLSILLLAGFLLPAASARANQPQAGSAQSGGVTAFDLILAMNTLRVSNGLPALIEDPIINAVAQSTAEIMAANQMSWHIGDVRGRIQSAGYGGGAQVWATENFAVGNNMSIDRIMLVWADAEHMRPATNPAYCHVGAGVAKAANGRTYYVLQAAYTSGKACGEYSSPNEGTTGSNPKGGNPVSQIIVPVKIATPDADGKIYHVVQPGQSFWAIAIAYQITIRDLEFWNNLTRDSKLQIGERLFIPGSNTEGYATPTPVGMVIPSPPDTNGKIVHTVEPYHTLITIARAYEVTVDTLLALNGLQVDWPLQIGQKLLISPGKVTPSPTPRPLAPLEKLTPASDGAYYHTVQSGESLSWIAGLYNISLSDLISWNGLATDSIIRPNQKLLLRVTPPATLTSTPGPPTATAAASVTGTSTRLPSTLTRTPTPTELSPVSPAATASTPATEGLVFGVILAAAGLILLFGLLVRKKPY